MGRFSFLLAGLGLGLGLVGGCGDGEGPVGAAPPAAGAKQAVVEDADWFRDVAAERGVTLLNRTGVPAKKEFIMGAVGPGCVIFDADGDGRLDLYIANGSWLVGPKRDRFYAGEDRPRNALYIQQPDGSFVDEAHKRGVDDDAWSFGACAADLDDDGDQDLLVANFGANRLYRNDGKGFFTDVAEQAGVRGSHGEWSTGIAVADYDQDGLLDVYIANYADLFDWMATSPDVKRTKDGAVLDARGCTWQGMKVYCGPLGIPKQQDHLYRGTGALRFEDVTRSSGVYRDESSQGTGQAQYGFQVLFTDLNADGWLDIYVANDSVPSFYFENQQDGTFVECAGRRGIQISRRGENQAGMGAVSGDLDGDGLMDLVKTNFAAEPNNVYVASRLASGEILFTDQSARTGVESAVLLSMGWGAALFDYDHDGDLDLLFANGHVYPEVDAAPEVKMSFKQRNQLFRNDRVPRGNGKRGFKLRFREVTAHSGPGLKLSYCTRGLSIGDIDEDGDLDVLFVNLNDPPNLLLNELGNQRGRWLKLHLVGNPGRKVNLDAIGCRVSVRAGDAVQVFETKRGSGWLGSNDPRVHVGLGAYEGPVEVEVVWP
ncbi:MAG: CRTAC1 family protein, partial [Planctomycetota bacterium]|nr:CRTAC1 family protein [Planctomycetota bacterium]